METISARESVINGDFHHAPVEQTEKQDVEKQTVKAGGGGGDGGSIGVCGQILWVLSVILVIVTFPVSLVFCLKVLTKDSVTVAVDGVVYYRVSDAAMSIVSVEDAGQSTRLLAATTLRNVLGTKNLSEILSDRENISRIMQVSLDEATDPWGVKVERVEVKDVRLPIQMQRAMAAEAESAREARAKVIAAEGEHKASKALKEAADIITQSPAALQLRYLQTLTTIAAEKNSTIIFPLPVDLLTGFTKRRTSYRALKTVSITAGYFHLMGDETINY